MRLKPDKLQTHLENSQLEPLYFISGDEPLQVIEASDLIRYHARQQGIEERTVFDIKKGFDWNQIKQEDANLSLFSSRKLLELRLGNSKPGKEGSAALIDFLADKNSDNILLITSAKIDKKTQQTKWYKALESAGVCIEVWPVDLSELPGWISWRVSNQGKKISHDAATLIAQRVEGNLLAAKQEIDKLCLLAEETEITAVDVMHAVSDSARFNVFTLIESAYSGNIDRALHMLRGLRNEGAEPIAVFGAIIWEFRRTCNIAFEIGQGNQAEKVLRTYQIWQQKKYSINKLLKRYTSKQLSSFLHDAYKIDKIIKGAIKENAWEEIENFLLRLSGASSEAA